MQEKHMNRNSLIQIGTSMISTICNPVISLRKMVDGPRKYVHSSDTLVIMASQWPSILLVLLSVYSNWVERLVEEGLGRLLSSADTN